MPHALSRLTLAATVATLLVTPAVADHEMEGRDLALGRQLYDATCAACHGLNLEGQPNWQTPLADGTLPAPPHDVTGHTWHHGNDLLFDYTQKGGAAALAERGVTGFQSAMPAFGPILTDAEIWTILAYIRSTWPEQAQQIQAARSIPHD